MTTTAAPARMASGNAQMTTDLAPTLILSPPRRCDPVTGIRRVACTLMRRV